jgi:hypothetical protein
LTLILPSVSTDATTGTVTVTPFQITVGKSALSDAAISPLISQVSKLEAAVNGQTVTGNDCADIKELAANLANPAETVGNVALGVFSNGGGFDLDLGGVQADTLAPTDFVDPFGSGAGADTSAGALPPDTFGSSGSFANGVPPGSLPPSAAGAPAGGSTTTTAPTRAAAPGALSSAVHCQSTSPGGKPGCWGGDAAVVGGVALAAGGILFLADITKGRRSRRKSTKEAVT